MRAVANGRYELNRLTELGRVSASLLHEISNPLTSALLNIEQFADNSSPAIKEARRSIRRMYKYVEAARQQAKLQSARSNFSLPSQVNQIKRLVAPIAKSSGVQLKIEPLPSCRLFGDPVKFQQILANLIVNAIEAYDKATASGLGRPVTVKVIMQDAGLLIMVSDRGAGIAPSDFKRIFEPYFSTKSMQGKGLGIGLSIVKEYVTRDFKGSLRVQSSRRHGTIFTVKIPWHVK